MTILGHPLGTRRGLALVVLAIALVECIGCAGSTGSAGSGRLRLGDEGQAPFDPAYVAWNRVLTRAVRPGGIDYPAVRDHLNDLRLAIAQMHSVTARDLEGWSRPARLAFWINAHNALALERVASRTPPAALRDGWFASDRRRRDIQLPGGVDSLAALEGVILGPEFNEVRAMFLLNWGARGCAPLPAAAVTELNLADLLDRQTRRIFSDPAYCRFEPGRNLLHLTSLVRDHRDAVERQYTTLWILAEHYVPAGVAAALHHDAPRIEFMAFDRRLNDAATSSTLSTRQSGSRI